MKKPTGIVATRLGYSIDQPKTIQKIRSNNFIRNRIALNTTLHPVYCLTTFKPHRKTITNNLAILFKYDTEKRQIYLK